MIDGIVLGWLCDGDVKGRFMDSVLKAMAQMQERCIGWIYEESGPLLASARNRMVAHFLGGTYRDGRQGEWLLMPDADMTFDKRDIELMMQTADPETVPILGGLCFCGGRDSAVWPSLLIRTPGEDGFLDIVRDYPKNTLCKVDATGTGFLLVHRSVFETMYETFGFLRNADGSHVLKDGQPVEHPYPWFAYGQNAGRPTGEDIAFPVDPATPVLGADWRWRSISSFGVGDQVLAFDERSPRSSSRRFQRADVTGVVERRLPRLRIVTDDQEIITTAEHPWLARGGEAWRAKERWHWTPAGGLGPGMTIASVVPVEANPDIHGLDYAAGYAQGLMHSDGTSTGRQHVVRMKDTEPLERMATMLALLGIESRRGPARWDGHPNHAPMHRLSVNYQSSVEKLRSIVDKLIFPSAEFAAGYLAGMYDGDGYQSGGNLCIASRNDRNKDRLETAARMIGVPFTARDARSVRISTQADTFRFWQRTLPSMSRRTEPYGQTGNDGTRRGREVKHTPSVIRAVEVLPPSDVLCLTTTSSTFIADGLASHNCLRARALDIPIHVHTGIRVGHIKPTVLNEELYDQLRAHEMAEKAQAKKVVPIHQGRTTISPKAGSA